MARITVPITRGGNTFLICLIKSPTIIATTPPTTHRAENRVDILRLCCNCCHGRYICKTDSDNDREPWTRDRILLPYSCRNVDNAANTSETWISSPIFTFPPALFAAFATRIAGVTHPTTAASTCWAARGRMSRLDVGLPSHLNSSSFHLRGASVFVIHSLFPFRLV